MKSSAQIQEAHENAVLFDGLEEHNRSQGTAFKVVSRPDPPDAILSDGSATTWLELTDAFYSPDWARNLSSHNSIKGHVPMARGPHFDMDRQFAETFCDLIQHKAGKASYRSSVQNYGPGILVVGLESPWLDDQTLDAITAEWCNRGSPDLSDTFAFIYIRYRAALKNTVRPWPLKKQE